jgi:hypothetical protein
MHTAEATAQLKRVMPQPDVDGGLDALIDQRGEDAHALGRDLRKVKASEGEAAVRKGELMRAIEAEIEARLPATMDRSRLDRLREEVTERQRRRDDAASDVAVARREVQDAEQLVRPEGPSRAPSGVWMAIVGLVLAALFGAVLTPTIPLLLPELRSVTGEVRPEAHLLGFLIGLGVGVAVVVPSFFAARYHARSLVARFGPAAAAMMVVLGIGLLRAFQVGEWNAAVMGLVVVEFGVVVFVEVVAAVIRARFREQVPRANAEAHLNRKRLILQERQKAELDAEKMLGKHRDESERAERDIRSIQELIDKRTSFVAKGVARVQEQFSRGYSLGGP